MAESVVMWKQVPTERPPGQVDQLLLCRRRDQLQRAQDPLKRGTIAAEESPEGRADLVGDKRDGRFLRSLPLPLGQVFDRLQSQEVDGRLDENPSQVYVAGRIVESVSVRPGDGTDQDIGEVSGVCV